MTFFYLAQVSEPMIVIPHNVRLVAQPRTSEDPEARDANIVEVVDVNAEGSGGKAPNGRPIT